VKRGVFGTFGEESEKVFRHTFIFLRVFSVPFGKILDEEKMTRK
jgi:hypothetical protein